MKFNDFIKEKNVLLVESNEERVKLHLSHLEDLAIERGKQGFNDFEDHVVNLLNFLLGLSSNTHLNAKIDGSPAIFFGTDPRPNYNGHFFVATKSAFSLGSPKINHSNKEIEENYGDSSVSTILKNCLVAFSKCYDNSGLIYQGDLLFSSEADKKINDINGIKYLTFKPNTLVYAVPLDPSSVLYQRISSAQVGIILHDSFKPIITNNGNSISTKPAGKNFENIKNLGQQNNVFIEDSTYPTVNLNISSESRSIIRELLKRCKIHIDEISSHFDNEWKGSPLLTLIKMYLNYQVRTDGGIFKRALKKEIFDADVFKSGFKRWIHQKFWSESEKLKTDKGKIKILSRRDALFEWIDQNDNEFSHLLNATYLMLLIKNEFLKIVHEVGDKIGKVFYQKPDGTFEAAKGEGFVLFIGNNQAKLVDRMDFTTKHFTKANENI